MFSLFSLGASFQVAHQHALQKVSKLIVVLGFSMGTSVMVFRQAEQTLFGIGISVVIGLVLGFLLQKEIEDTQTDLETIEKGFTWVAWAEGLTVLVLFGLFMPCKYLLGINIDAGTGVIGWTHGVFVILYVIKISGLIDFK